VQVAWRNQRQRRTRYPASGRSEAASAVCENGPRIVAQGAGDATARMRVRAAHVESRQRRPQVGMARHRPGADELIERQSAMEDVAADQPEPAPEIKLTHDYLKQGRRRGEYQDATDGCSVQALHKNLR
jgi:hypothetical protein